MTNSKPRRLKASEKEEFRQALLAHRAVLCGDASRIEDEALNRSGNGGSNELSNVPFHMADVGTENYDREFSLGILEGEQEELREIDEALARIEDDTYGICESCERAIPVARLRALAYARMCVECKEKHEQSSV